MPTRRWSRFAPLHTHGAACGGRCRGARCAAACGEPTAAPGDHGHDAVGHCVAACTSRFGMRDWISIHMRFKGRTWRGVPLPKLIRDASLQSLLAQPHLASSSASAVRSLCCRLVHGGLEQCTNGCIPGQPLNWSDATGPLTMDPKKSIVHIQRARRHRGHTTCSLELD